jgi:teichuronic acid biosynthesis glycosyltransferase TuaC
MNKTDTGAENMKILVVTKRQYTGKDLLDDRFGRLRELPLELGLRNHAVRGLCLSYQKRFEGMIQDGPVKWESLNAGAMKIPGLLRFIRRASADAVQTDLIWACSDSFYGIIGYFLSRKHRIPLVFDLYDNFEYFLAGRIPIIRQFYHWVLRKSDAVTCVSQSLAQLVKSYGRNGPLHVLENGVRKDLFKPLDKRLCRKDLNLPQDCRIVGTAGAIFRNRGIITLFEAFERLKTKYPDLHLTLAGPRDTEIPRSSGIIDLGILPLEKVPLLLNALDIAVICNRENDFGRYCFPQKAREIMACDTPLIAAKVGIMADLLADHPSWLFVADDAGDLSRAVESRLTDRATSYQRVPSWSDLANNLEAFFLEIIQETGHSLSRNRGVFPRSGTDRSHAST